MRKSKPKPCKCRRCGRTPPEVSFPGLGRTLCLPCRTEQRAGRLAKPGAFGHAPSAGTRSLARAKAGAEPEHLAWVRSLGCVVCRPGGGRAVHAHHVRDGTGGGMGMKPPDWWTVPLCAAHHSELHTVGGQTFELRYRVDLRALARLLASRSPSLQRA